MVNDRRPNSKLSSMHRLVALLRYGHAVHPSISTVYVGALAALSGTCAAGASATRAVEPFS
jgi:hypothetical protein